MEQEETKNDGEKFGILVDCAPLFENGEDGEQRLYEALRTLAEEAPEREIAALVRSENAGRTESEIKAIFRAAVYGEISLLFGDIFTKEDAEEAKECAQRAFRSLLEEKHEFNGFLPKGILIDTPLALLSEIPRQGFDFFCIDRQKITSLLLGTKKSNSDLLWQKAKELVQKYSPKRVPLYESDSKFLYK